MKSSSGFSLVELMITLVLGLVISGAVIQVLVSSNITNPLNQAVSQVQESGRFITHRLTQELLEVGRYDGITTSIDDTVDPVVEAAYVQNHPVAVPGDFVSDTLLGSTQSGSGSSDTLMVSKLASQDCTGNRHGYLNNDEFHVVNLYYLSGNEFKCTGYDGRVLRGLKVQTVSPTSVVLLDNVHRFHVQFGVSDTMDVSNGQTITYITADEVGAYRDQNQQVVSLRWALLLASYQNQVQQTTAKKFALLNESAISVSTDHYYQVFSKTIALRNMKNLVRTSG